MKLKQIELDVDFIGGYGALTKEEEKAIREYLRTKKILREKRNLRKRIIHSRKKITA